MTGGAESIPAERSVENNAPRKSRSDSRRQSYFDFLVGSPLRLVAAMEPSTDDWIAVR
jgi:hypothetical protein